MDGWLLEATKSALDRVAAHAEIVDLPNTDEATFRSFFMAALRERHPSVRMQTEWHKFDLLVQLEGRNTLLEFKYYVARRTTELSGTPGNWKGGAGRKNTQEFWQCVEKLRACRYGPMYARCIVQAYERLPDSYPRQTYHASFGALATDERFAEVVTLGRDPLICNVIRLR